MFVFAGLVLCGRSVHAAHWCMTPSSPEGGAAIAEMVFSGEITKVERLETRNASWDYLVTFKVDNWWKGPRSWEVRVLWRTSFMDCELPVGEVGETYLVYADPSISTTKDKFPEVTYFNRTSRLPKKPQPESFVLGDWREPRIDPKPWLNRADASEDIKVLRVLRQCSCLSTTSRTNETQPDSKRAEQVSPCDACLRMRLKPYLVRLGF